VTALNRRTFLASTLAASVLPATRTAFASSLDAPKFKLGLVSYMVSQNWDLKTTLDICAKVGIAAVECRTTHQHGVEPSLNADQRKDIKKQFADSGVTFWGCGSICEFHAADPKVVQKNIDDCKSFIQLVADVGGKGVKVRPNGVAKGMAVEAACKQIGRALIPCGEAAKKVGLEIWVEVHGAVTADPKNMKMIMDACGHDSVGVTWNSNDGEVENGSIKSGFELLSKHIKSCHINDLEKDARGKYPYRELFKLLKSIDYDRYTMIEVGKAYDPDAGLTFLKNYKAKWTEMCAG
jgi:sugar phosphate isomerase/epimerase